MTKKILMVYGLAMLLGILTGALGSFFQLAIHGVNTGLAAMLALVGPHPLVTAVISALLSMILVLFAWWMVYGFAPEASGSGIQEVEGALLHTRTLHWRRLLPVKFIGGVFAISAKMVVGREGPTIQMGGSLGSMLAEWCQLKSNRKDTLIAAGAAAGLATAFNAPLAGILFIIEEMRNEFNFNFTNFKMVALSCVMATITTRWIMGGAPAIPMMIFATPSLRSLWLFFLLGLVVGLAGLLFNRILMKRLSTSDRLSVKQRIGYVAFIGALVGFISVYRPDLVGGGYEIIEHSLSFYPGIKVLIVLFVIRWAATLLCYTTNVPGGIFAPMLALGTLLGLVCFYLFNLIFPTIALYPGMFAVAGMGALFAAVIRSPLTGIVLVVEMTQNYSLILPLMVSCFTSTTMVQLAKVEPIYTQLLRRTLKNQGG